MKKVCSTFLGLLVYLFVIGSSFAEESVRKVLNQEQLLAELFRIALPLHGKSSSDRNCIGFNAFKLQNGNVAYVSAGHCVYGYYADQDNKVTKEVRWPLGRDYLIAERKMGNEKLEFARPSFEPFILGESYYTFSQNSQIDPISSFGIIWMVYCGVVRGNQTDMHTFRMLSTSVWLQRFSPGLSGSPVLNKFGDTVAIGTAILPSNPGLIAAVPLFLLREKFPDP